RSSPVAEVRSWIHHRHVAVPDTCRGRELHQTLTKSSSESWGGRSRLVLDGPVRRGPGGGGTTPMRRSTEGGRHVRVRRSAPGRVRRCPVGARRDSADQRARWGAWPAGCRRNSGNEPVTWSG